MANDHQIAEIPMTLRALRNSPITSVLDGIISSTYATADKFSNNSASSGFSAIDKLLVYLPQLHLAPPLTVMPSAFQLNLRQQKPIKRIPRLSCGVVCVTMFSRFHRTRTCVLYAAFQAHKVVYKTAVCLSSQLHLMTSVHARVDLSAGHIIARDK